MRGRRTLVLATPRLIPGHGQARPGHLGSAEADRDCDLGAGEVSRTRTQAGAVRLTGSPGHNLNSSHHHRPPSRRLSHRASALEYRVPPARRRPVTGGHGHWPGPGPCGPGQTEAGLCSGLRVGKLCCRHACAPLRLAPASLTMALHYPSHESPPSAGDSGLAGPGSPSPPPGPSHWHCQCRAALSRTRRGRQSPATVTVVLAE